MCHSFVVSEWFEPRFLSCCSGLLTHWSAGWSEERWSIEFQSYVDFLIYRNKGHGILKSIDINCYTYMIDRAGKMGLYKGSYGDHVIRRHTVDKRHIRHNFDDVRVYVWIWRQSESSDWCLRIRVAELIDSSKDL